jgi:hypothetical protein
MSLLDLRATLAAAGDREEKEGIRIFSLESALIACSPDYFSRNSTDARAALAMIREASGILTRLLEGGHSTIAGRVAGAFRNVGRDRVADDITKTMSAAGYDVREKDPFTDKPARTTECKGTYLNIGRCRARVKLAKGRILIWTLSRANDA